MHKKKAYQMRRGAAGTGKPGMIIFGYQEINSGSVALWISGPALVPVKELTFCVQYRIYDPTKEVLHEYWREVKG